MAISIPVISRMRSMAICNFKRFFSLHVYICELSVVRFVCGNLNLDGVNGAADISPLKLPTDAPALLSFVEKFVFKTPRLLRSTEYTQSKMVVNSR